MTIQGTKLTKKQIHQAALAEQCRVLKLPPPTFEVRFAKEALGRLWRFDLSWQVPRAPIGGSVAGGGSVHVMRADVMLAVEIDGGAFIPGGGHHSRGQGMRDDMEKKWEAAILGWSVLSVMPEHVKSGQAVRWIERFFKDRGVIP